MSRGKKALGTGCKVKIYMYIGKQERKRKVPPI